MSLIETLHDSQILGRRGRILSEHVAEQLPADASVLDVGCGSGDIAAQIMRQRKDVSIRGIDILVREKTAIPVKKYDGSTFPFEDDTFDAVTFVDVLHHTNDIPGLLSEARRIARTCIILKDHTQDGPLAGLRLGFMDRVGNCRFGVSVNYNYWPKERWDDTFVEIGLHVDVWKSCLNLYPWPLSTLFDSTLHFVARLTTQPAYVRLALSKPSCNSPDLTL